MVLEPAPVIVVAPEKIVVAEEEYVPVTVKAAFSVTFALAVIVLVPLSVREPFAMISEFTVSEPVPLSAKAPAVVKLEFAITELAVLIVTALKALDPLPEIVVVPPKVKVPAVKFTEPSFTRFPSISKLTAPFNVFPFPTETFMNVLVPAPNKVEVPLNKIVPPL